VKFVGVGGGIGSGKSTVSAALAERGAYVIDVDDISRQVQRSGTPAFRAIVERWGSQLVAPNGELDRLALGRIVFADAAELAVLTASITGPAIEAVLLERARAHLGTDDVVVVEAALILGGDRRMYGMEGVIHVDVSPETAVVRLVARGMDEDDARARLAKQVGRQARLQQADFVIDNSGSLDALEAQVDAVWRWIASLPDAVPRAQQR
jgi:dephospho-CoA kinase